MITVTPTEAAGMFRQTFLSLLRQKAAAVYSVFLSAITYLLPPDRRMASLAIVVAFDIITRLAAESVHAKGFFKAISQGRIRSSLLFQKTFVKILAYLVLLVAAHQASFILHPSFYTVVDAYIYAFLFMVELISNIENLIEAGATQLAPMLLKFKRERDNLTGEPTAEKPKEPTYTGEGK